MTVAAALLAPQREFEIPADRRRDTVVRRFADLLFLPTGQVSPFEKNLVDDILSRLYMPLDYAMRLRLARRIAQLGEPPLRLTHLMAVDEAEIAQLFLAREDLFDEAELVALIRAMGPEHHAMLTRRASLPAQAAEALIETGDEAIIEMLLTNPGVSFTTSLYKKMAGLSRAQASYQELLLARDDLPAEIAHEMFWFVGPSLRRMILQRYSIERRRLVEAVADLHAAQGVLSEDLDWAFRFSGAARRRTQAIDISLLAAWFDRPEERPFCQRLSDALAIDCDTVARIAQDGGGEPLVVLLKALGLTASQFKALGPHLVSALADPGDGRVGQLSALFETLSTDWADLVLRLWDEQRPDAPQEPRLHQALTSLPG
jgi:hypothetical protein